MDTYPLFGSVRTNKWRRELLQNDKVKALFEKLSKEASREGIPLTSVTGHENVILTCAKLEHIDTRFGKSETLLHWAASYEPAYAIPSSKVLVLLLLGADPNIQDDLGRTPLHWAINHDCSDIAEDDELHYNRRSQANAVKVVYQLLRYKASPDVVDIYGASPFCHAVWSKCFHIADILRPLTSECFLKPPRFLFADYETMKSIRCSNVDQWIRQNTSNVTENEKRLQRLLSSPGTGLLQHPDEVEQQKKQVISFFKRLSCIIAKEDHLLEFVPTLAGSMAEGTKCQKPDEQDIILRLVKFEDVCIPEESEYAPEGVITLKFTGNESKTIEYQKYILDGYLNREEILYSLITKFERELSLVSNWSGKEWINIYPSHYPTAELKQAIDTGDIGNLTFVWHGKYYKQIKLSIDIVPAIIIRNWKPGYATPIDPTGGTVPNETFLILRAFVETFEYDLEKHGELNTDTERSDAAPTNIEILNGKDWDSGSDCLSETSDDDNDKEPVNSTSHLYNTFLVRKMREDYGYSAPTIKRLLRHCDSDFKKVNEMQQPYEKEKTAYDDYAQLHPFKKSRQSEETVFKFVEPDMTEECKSNRDGKTVPKFTVDRNVPSTSSSRESEACRNEVSNRKRSNVCDITNIGINITEANHESTYIENKDTKEFFEKVLNDFDQIQKKKQRKLWYR